MQDSLLYIILVLIGVVIYLLVTQRKNKEEPKDNTQELIDHGGFGSPTFFLNENKMYFGQDRITLMESQL